MARTLMTHAIRKKAACCIKAASQQGVVHDLLRLTHKRVQV